jgi:hypothetical protein
MSNPKVPCPSDAIWLALATDPDFRKAVPPGSQRQTYRDLIDQLPTVLADLLDEPVSFSSFCRTRLAVARHQQATNFPSRLFLNYTLEVHGQPARSEEARLSEAALSRVVAAFETIVGQDPKVALAQAGQTEEVLLFNPYLPIGLDESLRVETGENLLELYRRGELTIGQLLLTQPRVLLGLIAVKRVSAR